MIVSLLFSILAVVLIGFGLVSILWPDQVSLRSQFLLKLCLGVGIGFGFLSCVYFLQLSLFGPSRRILASTQVTLLILLVATFLYRIKSRRSQSESEVVREREGRSTLVRILS